MNPFLNPPAPDSTPPANADPGSVYYARFGQAEYEVAMKDGPSRTFVRLEAFSKPWFDEHPPPVFSGDKQGSEAFNTYYSEAPIAMLELEITKDHTGRFAALKELLAAAENDEEPKSWFLIRTGGQRGDLPIEEAVPLTVYTNLYADGTTLILEDIEAVGEATQEILELAVSTGHIRDAEEVELNSLLGHFAGTKIQWAVVYDVGQGNAIGLCGNGGTVQAYFDLGGGCCSNAKTFPSTLTQFCFTQSPPIILSHWDEDHWSSANRDLRALTRDWIVPRQKIGPSQAAMIANIQSAGGKIWFLPTGFSRTRYNQLELELATGSGRNNSGIILTLYENQDGSGEQILMPGDAGYPYISSFIGGSPYLSIVASHHGGVLKGKSITAKGKSIPRCPALPASRLVYSAGSGNTYGHPLSPTRKAHDSRGWGDPFVNLAPPPQEVRETSARSASGLGHVLLAWHSTPTAPAIRCASTRCQLQPFQT